MVRYPVRDRVASRTQARQILRGRGYAVRGMSRDIDHDFELTADGQPTILVWFGGGCLSTSAPLPPKRPHGGQRSRHAGGVILRREDAEAFAAWARRQGFTSEDALLAVQVTEGMAAAIERFRA